MPSSPTSQPKRPSMLARTSSASSAATITALSPGFEGGPSSRQQSRTHKPHKHVAGHGRLGQRNTSFGKNLNKLGKLTAAQGAEASEKSKHHRRSLSGNTTPTTDTPSVPSRPYMKRNASTVGPTRQATQTPIRKNLSSGALSRPSSSKSMLKPVRSEVAPPKRSLMKPGKSRQSPKEDKHPTVHFDVGVAGEDLDDPDDEWTEESASQSPHTTRSNTRSNSVILDSQAAAQTTAEVAHAESDINGNPRGQSQPPSQAPSRMLSRTNTDSHLRNGESSQQPSRPPDADIITSRLLRRTASHNLPPQMSSISATATPDPLDPRTLSNSQGSTLADTPGRDLVSRFMDGDGSASTPRDSNFLPARNVETQRQGHQTGDVDSIKRNKSVPNMAAEAQSQGASAQHSRTNSRRSAANTPVAELPPSRTQQKLYLQRASSNIEPQKLIPVILPRTGAPQYLSGNVNFQTTEGGRMDPRLKQQFEQVAKEYNIVRRHRNPLAESLARLDKLPKGTIRRSYTPQNAKSSQNAPSSQMQARSQLQQSQSVSQSQRSSREIDRDEDAEGRRSWEDERGPRNEAEEICRRMWESMEVPEADD